MAGRPQVVLDCSKVRQLDNAGIQVLLRCLEESMKRNGDVKLAAMPPGAATILKRMGVDRLFEDFDTIADAVDSFHQLPMKPFKQTPENQYSTIASKMQRNGLENGLADPRDQPPVSQVTLRTLGGWLRRQIAGGLLLLFIATLAAAAPSPQEEANLGLHVRDPSSAQARSQESNSGADKANTEPSQNEALPNSPGMVRSQTVDERIGLQQPAPRQQKGEQEPVGTAAAQPVKTTGVAASKPVGAAIAPAKQRRARSILIKVGVIGGASVAVATVLALSSASPSRPH
jgi:hypothetical protein